MNSFFNGKSITVALCLSVLVSVLAFNNCSDKDYGTTIDEAVQTANTDGATFFLGLLDEAQETADKLKDSDEPLAIAQANEIEKYIGLIMNLIDETKSNLPYTNETVQAYMDFLIHENAQGENMVIEQNFLAEITRLDAKDVELENKMDQIKVELQREISEQITALRAEMVAADAELRADLERRIASLEAQLATLESQFVAFQSQVDAKFRAVDGAISDIESRLDTFDAYLVTLEGMIEGIEADMEGLRASTATAIAQLMASIEEVRNTTQAQIIELREAQQELQESLAAQEQELQELIASEQELADIQGLMCELDSGGNVVGATPACTGSEADMLDRSCCLTVSVIDCDALYPNDAQVGTRNACNILKHTTQNLDDRVRILAEQNEQQTDLIAGLMGDVQNLAGQTEDLTDVLTEVRSNVDTLTEGLHAALQAIASLDMRLALEEFKSSRQEAIAGLNERSDHYLAWIARRQMDLRNRFCHHNSSTAFDRNDYEVARQNHQFCWERQNILNQAKELVHLAKAYTNGLGSLNVNESCTATIAGGPASALSDAQIRNTDIAEEVIEKCDGGQVLAKVLMINIVALQNSIGPDFRTPAYMAKRAKIVQLLYFGSEVALAPTAVVNSFENVDPTTDTLKDTYFGKVERAFKNNYVLKRLRVAGEFPEDPNRLGSSAGLNHVFTYAQIAAASTPYLARLKALDLEPHCAGQCGFQMVARNQARKIGDRYSYPEDFQTKCPIINDTVIIKSNDGKSYAYRLNYSRHQGATEVLTPHLNWNHSHRAIANSDADVSNGLFLGCGYRVRNIVHRFGLENTFLRGRFTLKHSTPYAKSHGLPQCRRTWIRCDLQQGTDGRGRGSWVASNSSTSNLTHHLSGFDTARITNKCQESGASYVAKTRKLASNELQRLQYFPAVQDAGSVSYGQQMNSGTTQLTQDYWMLRDRNVAYGSNNVAVSKTLPFYNASGSSHGNGVFRRHYPLSNLVSDVDVQQCYDPE